MPSPSAAAFYLDYTLSSLAGPYGEKVAGPRTLFAELLGADLEVGPGKARDSPDTRGSHRALSGSAGRCQRGRGEDDRLPAVRQKKATVGNR